MGGGEILWDFRMLLLWLLGYTRGMAEAPLDGIEEARVLFRNAHLDLPPIPADLARRFRRREKWCFSSRAVKRWPYLIDDYITEPTAGRRGNYVLLAHAGHGVNSYALHYYLVRVPLRLFLQVAWGGVYEDATQATADVNECFQLVAHLLEETRTAVERGHLSPHEHLLVVASSFYGGYCVLPGHQEPQPQHRDRSTAWLEGRPQDFLREALEWCRRR